VDGPAVYSTSNGWSETGVTWNNRPARTSGPTDDKGAVPANSWAEYDVKPFVTGNGTYSFVLATTSTDGADFYARESSNTTLRPELVVTMPAPGTDTEPPAAPVALIGTATSSGRVDLTWPPAADNVAVTGYEVFRDGTLIASPTDTSYSDTAAAPDSTYTYEVKARDAAGNRSSATGTTVTTPPDSDPPSAPTGLAATSVSANQVSLSWSAASDNVGVTGYEVFRDGALVGSPTDTSFIDTTVGPGTTYTYEVKARDAAGNRSGPSSSLTVTTSFTFSAVADANVEEASPTANYGWQPTLVVDNSPRFESFITFTVGNVSGTVLSAKLRLYAYDGSVDGPAIYTTTSDWSESGVSGITWATRPGPTSGIIDDKAKVTANTWLEYNVTPVVTGNGTYSFRIYTPSGDATRFNSREATSLKPELALTVG
jgi:chitodextrinase